MAAPTIRSSSQGQKTVENTTYDVVLPATVVDGDIFVIFTEVPFGTVLTPPGGWTTLDTRTVTTILQGGVYAKAATAAEAGTTVSFTSGTSRRFMVYTAAIAGADSTNLTLIIVSGRSLSSSQTTQTAFGLTTVSADNLLMGSAGSTGNGQTYTPPAGYTEVSDISSTVGTRDVGKTVAWATQAVTGATGDQSFTATVSSPYTAHLIAIPPTASTTGAVTATTTSSSSVFASRSDTGAISVTDTATSTITGTRTDTGAVNPTVASSATLTAARVDTGTVSTTDTVAVTVAAARTDTAAVTASITAAITVTAARTDTAAVTATTTATVTANGTAPNTVNATTASVGTVTATRSDTGSVSTTTTSASTLAASRTDTAAVSSTIIAVPIVARGQLPDQVTGLATGTPTRRSVSLSWNTAANATSYVVEYSLAGAGVWLPGATAITTTAVIATLAAGTGYDFRVVSRNIDGDAIPSTTASATTVADLVDANLLSPNTASIEEDPDGWGQVSTTPTTITRSTAHAADGAASLSLTRISGSGGLAARTAAAIAVAPGDTVTAFASTKAGSVSRSTYVLFRRLNSAGALLSSSTPTFVANNTTSFTELTASEVVPAGVSRVEVQIGITNGTPAAVGEFHFFDKIGLWRGTAPSTWAAPPIPDLSAQWTWWTKTRAVAVNGNTYVSTATHRHETVLDVYAGQQGEPSHRISLWALSGAPDDHDNPALVAVLGKPLLAIGFRHNIDKVLHWRKSTINIDSGVSFGPEQTLTLATPGNCTYAVTHVHGNNIYVVFRDSTTSWGFIKSTDWGVTWSASITLVSSSFQLYGPSRVNGDTLRMALTNHPTNGAPPDQDIHYVEMNLLTGSITKSDGTVLGNMDGTGLPISLGTLESAGVPPVVGYVTWVYDVGDGPDPEITWVSFNKNDVLLAGSSAYQYSKRVSGVWSTQQIVPAGDRFSDISEQYLGGAQIVPGEPGRVLVARESSGIRYVERKVTTDAGATWTTTVLGSTSGSSLVRAFPVRRLDNTPTFEAVANNIGRFNSYNDQDSVISPLGAVFGVVADAAATLTSAAIVTGTRSGTATAAATTSCGVTVTAARTDTVSVTSTAAAATTIIGFAFGPALLTRTTTALTTVTATRSDTATVTAATVTAAIITGLPIDVSGVVWPPQVSSASLRTAGYATTAH